MIADASALLAYLRTEEGGDAVEARLPSPMLSVVNLAEVQKRMLSEIGTDPRRITSDLVASGVTLLRPDEGVAAASRYALLPTPKGHRSVSLADGFCIAQAEALDLPLLTADRVWADLGLPVRVELLRQPR